MNYGESRRISKNNRGRNSATVSTIYPDTNYYILRGALGETAQNVRYLYNAKTKLITHYSTRATRGHAVSQFPINRFFFNESFHPAEQLSNVSILLESR